MPVGSSAVQFALDLGARQFTALEFVDGHSVDSPDNPTNLQGIRIVDNKSYTLEARVLTKGDEATIRIDLGVWMLLCGIGLPPILQGRPGDA